MKIVFNNATLEFRKFRVQILDHKENVTITDGKTSTASNIDTVIGRKYGALYRIKSVSGGSDDPNPYLYENAGVPRLGNLTYKQTTQNGYMDYYLASSNDATVVGKIGSSCRTGYTITYDVILFDLTDHPNYSNFIPEWDFDEISAMI